MRSNYLIILIISIVWSQMPDELLAQFGEPEKALSFTLTQERDLAKEDPVQVLQNLLQQGYHLQLPLAEE